MFVVLVGIWGRLTSDDQVLAIVTVTSICCWTHCKVHINSGILTVTFCFVSLLQVEKTTNHCRYRYSIMYFSLQNTVWNTNYKFTKSCTSDGILRNHNIAFENYMNKSELVKLISLHKLPFLVYINNEIIKEFEHQVIGLSLYHCNFK